MFSPARATIIIDETYEGVGASLQTLVTARGYGYVCTPSNSTFPCPTMELTTITGHSGSPTTVLHMIYNAPNCSAPLVCDDSNESKLGVPLGNQDEIYGRYWAMYTPRAGTLAWIDGNNPSSKQHYLNGGGGDTSAYCAANPLTCVSGTIGFDNTTNATNTPSWDMQADPNSNQPPCPGSGSLSNSCGYPANLNAIAVPQNTWVCNEYHAKINTLGAVDAVLETWITINGVTTQTSQYTGLAFRSPTHLAQWTKIQLIRQGATNNQDRYEDDFRVATTRIGDCVGTPDITAPSNPSSLTATAISALAFLMLLGGFYGGMGTGSISQRGFLTKYATSGTTPIRTLAFFRSKNRYPKVRVVHVETVQTKHLLNFMGHHSDTPEI